MTNSRASTSTTTQPVSDPVRFNVPWIASRQQEYMLQSMYSSHTSGDGPFTKRCQTLRLPFYTGLSQSDQLKVLSAVMDFHA